LRFVRLQRDQRLNLWYIGNRKQGFLRNHAIPPCTFLTPVGNRCITPCVCVKEPSPSRGVISTAGGLSVHKGTVFCRNIRRHIQRYWILRRICRSISCSAASDKECSVPRSTQGHQVREGNRHAAQAHQTCGDTCSRHPHGTACSRGAAGDESVSDREPQSWLSPPYPPPVGGFPAGTARAWLC